MLLHLQGLNKWGLNKFSVEFVVAVIKREKQFRMSMFILIQKFCIFWASKSSQKFKEFEMF